MAEAMTEERLENLRSHLTWWHGFNLEQGAKLIAEVDRLRKALASIASQSVSSHSDCEARRRTFELREMAREAIAPGTEQDWSDDKDDAAHPLVVEEPGVPPHA